MFCVNKLNFIAVFEFQVTARVQNVHECCDRTCHGSIIISLGVMPKDYFAIFRIKVTQIARISKTLYLLKC